MGIDPYLIAPTLKLAIAQRLARRICKPGKEAPVDESMRRMFEKEFVPTYIEYVSAYWKSFSKEDIERIGKEIYERNLASLPATNMSQLTRTYFVHGLIIGFFVNIILSVILRRQPKT